LGEKTVNADKEDTWVWKDGETKVFTVKSAYKILKEDIQGDLYVGFLRIKAQSSPLFTTWRVMEDKIASKTNLARRGISMLSSICCLCGEEEKTTFHLFCTCRVVWLVWSKCYEWMRVFKCIFKILRSVG